MNQEPSKARHNRMRRLVVGERVIYDGRVHVVTRVGTASATLEPEAREQREVVVQNRVVHRNGLTFKVPLETPEVKRFEPAPRGVQVSAHAFLERVA